MSPFRKAAAELFIDACKFNSFLEYNMTTVEEEYDGHASSRFALYMNLMHGDVDMIQSDEELIDFANSTRLIITHPYNGLGLGLNFEIRNGCLVPYYQGTRISLTTYFMALSPGKTAFDTCILDLMEAMDNGSLIGKMKDHPSFANLGDLDEIDHLAAYFIREMGANFESPYARHGTNAEFIDFMAAKANQSLSEDDIKYEVSRKARRKCIDLSYDYLIRELLNNSEQDPALFGAFLNDSQYQGRYKIGPNALARIYSDNQRTRDAVQFMSFSQSIDPRHPSYAVIQEMSTLHWRGPLHRSDFNLHIDDVPLNNAAAALDVVKAARLAANHKFKHKQ